MNLTGFLIFLLAIVLTYYLVKYYFLPRSQEGLTSQSFTGKGINNLGFSGNSSSAPDTSSSAPASSSSAPDTSSSCSSSTSSTTCSTNGSTSASPSGTSYDNYNHYTGASVSTIFYGPNGATAKVAETSGQYSVIVTDVSGNVTMYQMQDPNVASSKPSNTYTNTNNTVYNDTLTTYYGPNGGKARIIQTPNGQALNVQEANGNWVLYMSTQPMTYNPNMVNNANNYGSISGYGGQPYSSAPAPAPTTTSPPPPSTTSPSPPPPAPTTSSIPPPPSTTSPSPPSSTTSASSTTTDYSSSLPQGVSQGSILPGQEDLYILKSEVVPPVCPVCQVTQTCPNNKLEKCPPCPACARCPEPNFECKKVPNYNAINDQYLPMPVLNDFSTFGM